MTTSSTLRLAAAHLLLFATFAQSDEAIEHDGKRQAGQLLHEKDAWFFRTDAAQQIPLDQLAHVRFDARPTPVSKAPLLDVLVLPHEQRVTGTLVSVDTKNIVFAASWGKLLTLPREGVVGIASANDSLKIVRDDFESDLKAWQRAGASALNGDQAFYGKYSLRFDAAGQDAARTWKPGVRTGAIRLYFYDAGSPIRWRCAVLLDNAKSPVPTFAIDADGYSVIQVTQPFAAQKRTPGWHLLGIESADERLRVFVDDVCLGQSTLSEKGAIVGIRCSSETGTLWVDELSVTRRLPPLPAPKSPGNQDALWLEHGEQLFGRIVGADQEKVVLDAKFGKRSYPWVSLRGIQFAQPKTNDITPASVINFRPGPGFSLDRLQGKLIRWEKDQLIVEHRLLGEIAVERSRLDKVRPVPK